MLHVYVESSTTCAIFFFFNDTATTEIYTLSLHDALPICPSWPAMPASIRAVSGTVRPIGPSTDSGIWPISRRSDGTNPGEGRKDRKSTRLNSSHANISYAVFCLKKKNKEK